MLKKQEEEEKTFKGIFLTLNFSCPTMRVCFKKHLKKIIFTPTAQHHIPLAAAISFINFSNYL